MTGNSEKEAPLRQRLDLKGELALALLPTATALVALMLLEALSKQRLLFGSLVASAFLIYLHPHGAINSLRVLTIAHLLATTLGVFARWVCGPGYIAAGGAMVGAILLMIALDVVHPPAVGATLNFALQSGAEDQIVFFLLTLLIIVLLVILQRAVIWLYAWLNPQR